MQTYYGTVPYLQPAPEIVNLLFPFGGQYHQQPYRTGTIVLYCTVKNKNNIPHFLHTETRAARELEMNY